MSYRRGGGGGQKGEAGETVGSFYPDVKVALTSVSPFTIYSAPLSFCVTPATLQFYIFSTINLSHFDLKDLLNLLIKCKIDI